MRPTIDLATVRRIARLARLKLSDDEIQLHAGQLARILGYMDQLEAVETSEVEPLAQPLSLTNVLREDVPRPGVDPDIALCNAPEREGSFFRVPRVLDDRSGA